MAAAAATAAAAARRECAPRPARAGVDEPRAAQRHPDRAGERQGLPEKDGHALTGVASGSVRLEAREEIEAKFRDNAERTLSPDAAQRLREAIGRLEALPEVTGLMRLPAA